MIVKKVSRATAAGLALFLIGSTQVSADIYRYVDNSGVWHFTNIKSDSKYRLYVRTTSKRAAKYIKEYEGIILQASRQFGTDPSLIKAVIKAESDFNDRAVSQKGAQGLMQLMPQTADAMEVENPFNAEENIFGGTRYFSLLLKRFKNDKILALAAYNAGAEKVEACGGIPPISETRTFVKRVMKYYQLYNPKAE